MTHFIYAAMNDLCFAILTEFSYYCCICVSTMRKDTWIVTYYPILLICKAFAGLLIKKKVMKLHLETFNFFVF